MRKGRYYLGRVMKINLSQEDLMNAIIKAATVSVGKFDWTITDVQDNRLANRPFIFGKISKYAKDGHAKVVDEAKRSQVQADVPNLVDASSPFIYLPDFSGIAFLHVSEGIPDDVFSRRFKSIVESAFGNILVSCDVEPIVDYRAFTTRLKKLSSFIELSATVYPPNPLFGRLWESLNTYIKERNASEVSVKESTSKNKGLNSKIIELMDEIVKSANYEPKLPPAISDAAILMAADGYGKGKVVGIEDGNEVIVKTSDSQKSFLFSKDPDPCELADIARTQYEQVSRERDMSH